jgi:glycosyltransferase involved in cell wall biosynthesis
MPNTFASKFKGGESGFWFRLLLLEERISAAYCTRVITVHDPVKNGILVKHGLSPDRIEVIANFADADVFPLRTSFEVNGKIRFAFHGTILERSGLRLLMNALAQVRNKDKILVKIVGEGDFSSTLKELVQQLDLGGIVEFDNRSYPARLIAAQLDDCHVGLVPLEISSVTNYALPLKLLEYISMGLPVVAVRSDAITYYFSEDDCIFFEKNDPSSLSRVFDCIAEDPTILVRYRNRSLALRDRFSWTAEKAKYIKMLRELTGCAPHN